MSVYPQFHQIPWVFIYSTKYLTLRAFYLFLACALPVSMSSHKSNMQNSLLSGLKKLGHFYSLRYSNGFLFCLTKLWLVLPHLTEVIHKSKMGSLCIQLEYFVHSVCVSSLRGLWYNFFHPKLRLIDFDPVSTWSSRTRFQILKFAFIFK